MSKSRLPEYVDPYHLANNGERLEGSMAVRGMERLQPLLQGEAADIEVRLEFVLQDRRVPIITGSVRAELPLLCQRCLEPMIGEVNPRFHLAVVKSQHQAERLPDNLEPLLLEEGNLSIRTLIEDEILLALPLVARHEPEDCAAEASTDSGAEPPASEQKKNPFAVLESLKKNF